MPDFADQDVKSWAGGVAAGAPAPAAHAEPDGDEGDGDEGERGAVEILTDLQAATDSVVAELEALDVTDEPQGVKSKLRTLLADLQETQTDTAAMIEAYNAAHEDDEEEEKELLGDEVPAKKKAAGPPKKGAKKGAFGAKDDGGDDAEGDA
jgi:hypothetical protein